jgi:hypothetical protein
VKQGLRDAGARGDPLHRGLLVAKLAEALESRREDARSGVCRGG